MQTKVLKWIFPVAAIVAGVMGAQGINALANEPSAKEQLDTRPVVSVEAISALDHQVVINSYGEVQPYENTRLSAQVSGEVIAWHPNFVTGGVVAKGEVLLSIEKDNYEAALLQAEAEVSRAQAKLIEEQALADVAADEAKRYPNKKHTDLFLRKPQILSAKAGLKSSKAALKRAQRDLENCDILAPYDALIVSRDVGVGQFVNMGSSVAELNNIEYAEVVIPIAGFDSVFLPDRIEGIDVTITHSGLNGYSRSAKIHRDLGVVDKDTRMVNLVVRINDPYGLQTNQPQVKFGSYVQVNFPGTTLNSIYRLPQDLVNNNTVWLLNSEGQLESRKVKVIREEGEYFYISTGLQDNEKLVTTVPEYPQTGMSVKVAGSDSSKAEAIEKL